MISSSPTEAFSSGLMACGARLGLKPKRMTKPTELLIQRLNGLWSPFKGRNYSASRISSAYAVFVDLPVMPVLPHWLTVTSGVFGVLFAGSEGKGSVAMGVSRPRAKNQAA